MTPLRLLSIDDDESDVFLIVHDLRKGGFDVTWERVASAKDLGRALELPVWDVITCDWMMPSFGGPEALAQLRDRGVDTPIIVVTGQVGEEFAVTAMKAGANDFVCKDNLGRLVPAVERELLEAERRRERARAQAALQESNERLRLAQEAGKVIVWDSDLTTGTTTWSDPVPGNSQVLPHAFDGGGIAFLAMVHPEDRDRVRRSIVRAVTDDIDFDVAFRVLLDDGGIRWVESRGRALRDGHGNATRLLGVSLDVTERKRAEELLERSQHQFRSLVENALDLVAILDPDGRLRYLSPSHEQALGFTPEELTGRLAFDFIHPEDKPRIRQLFVEGIRVPGSTVKTEYRFHCKDGSWAVLEIAAKNLLDDPVVEGVIVNSRDVTDRRRAQDARRDVEARLRILVEAAFEGLCFSRDGILVEANDRLAATLGYQREEIIGMSVLDLTAPQSRELVRAMVAADLPGPYEALGLRKDGTVLPVEIQARRAVIAGQTVRVTAVRDISERNRTAEELERLNATLERRRGKTPG